ncbi:hypothetical protein MHM84_00795 [Halomonas sp. McH1-25]|uniref:hypothetical protein n=1 Tax=unclassified Halomonas TaxID=2609666 RepID=UPI001EF50DFC|nr:MULTISPECIES: hypothetical protein [unclassified Halomonas]MCG7598318.1 hypothetical protein [Halomonas sp. McH1-25]MCP1340899.1 hypothetical protein [Halomonas sp. FL8]MCP1361622.1 hypothetical protein [Halomonas sp. BBD45]MCP1365027.1 hypothetical protein [Halomonas sp. BBD48]
MLGKTPVAYSQRYYEKTLISANRLLGLPNPVWSGVATAMLGMTCWFASGLTLWGFLGRYGLWLVGVACLLWLLLKCITPSRSRLRRVALQEHQAEVLRVAKAYAVDPTSIRVVDSEEERRECEEMPVSPRLSA